MALYLSALAGAGWQFFDDNGGPLSGGKLYTYVAGTTTPATTYTSISGAAANTNPIILDSAGRVPEEIWLISSQNYKFILKSSTDVTIWTKDQITGVSGIGDLTNTSNINLGDALVGFKQSNSAGFLTGAVASTVHNKLQEFVSVKDFGAKGDGSTDDFAAITAAIAAADSIYLPVGIYAIGTPISLLANKLLYGPGTIRGVAGYTYKYLMTLDSGSTLSVYKLDGTGMQTPTTSWTGAGTGTARAPIGSAVFINGSFAGPVVNATIQNVTFTNFPSGPVCGFYANNVLIQNCAALNTQTTSAYEPNAVYSLNYSNFVRLVDCYAKEFNYKVFYLGNCYSGLMSGCVCQTTSSMVSFDASHYVSGGFNHIIIGCQSETAFGVKLDNANSVVVDGYTSLNSSSGGIIIQSSTDITVSNCNIRNPAQYGIAVVAENTIADARRIRISNCNVVYASPGVGINQTGYLLQVVGGTSKVIDDVEINNSSVTIPYFGVHIQQLSGATISRVRLNGLSIYQPTQYGILTYAASLEIANCMVYGANTVYVPLIACYTQPGTSGSYLRAISNRTYAISVATEHWNIGTGGSSGNSAFSTIEFTGNHADNGNYFLRYDGTLGGSTLNTLTVTNNLSYLTDAPYVIDLTMGTTLSTCIMGNSLVGSGVRKGIQVTNAASVTDKVDGGATGNNINTGQPVYV